MTCTTTTRAQRHLLQPSSSRPSFSFSRCCSVVVSSKASSTMPRFVPLVLVAAAAMNSADAFVSRTAVQTSTTREDSALYFGIPTFGAKDDSNKDSKDEEPEKKIGLSGLAQLITAGMGSPFLGDFEGVDKETGKFMFSLEANNLVDEVRSVLLLRQYTMNWIQTNIRTIFVIDRMGRASRQKCLTLKAVG